jgi:two-component system chemotaxis sensor kinase CheA
VAVELEKIMREKDKFQTITNKIESFKTATTTGGNLRQDQYVLTETLSKACEKAASAMNKQVNFTVDSLDVSSLEKGPRRVIKEVLTQLVRNSVYHGIESPKERVAGGKEAAGTISLNITQENNQIHIKLSDDGKGLNFEAIKQKALKLKLLRKEDADNQSQLIKIIFAPGFSTVDSSDHHAGRGIGLNLVRNRIKNLRGNIKLSSQAGKGTVFYLFIPVNTPVS